MVVVEGSGGGRGGEGEEGEGEEGGGEGGDRADIESNNPHLTGGEKPIVMQDVCCPGRKPSRSMHWILHGGTLCTVKIQVNAAGDVSATQETSRYDSKLSDWIQESFTK